jgi:ABC-type transport system involved in multi-copper enzyme maturation permease subunit
MSASELSAWQATRAMASLTWLRTRRSRTLWISLALVMLPVIQGAVVRVAGDFNSLDSDRVWRDLLIAEFLLLAVLCPLYGAASLGEEIDSGTMTYLWSRPLARWTIAAGKLAALTPIVMVLIVASATAAMLVARNALPPVSGLVALAIGAISISIASAGIAMLVPRHSMVVPIAYFLFLDLPIGELPAALYRLSMSHHLRVLAVGDSGSTATAAIWLGALTSFWAAIGLWKLRTLE